jgi:hypothetical protein
MLFQSVQFLFLFLPLVWLGFVVLHLRAGLNTALTFLVAASAFFYAWHTPHYLLIIAVSICVNFTIGKRLSGSDGRVLLGCGIAFNLGLLVVFKYADFIVENLNLFRVEELTLPAFVLPLAISFYTFQQIAYLIDVSRGHKSVKSILRYAFFVGFFPQLIAGPIVHQHEILPQLNRMSPNTRRIVLNLCIGLTIFFLGLAKKLLIADNVGEIADDVFDKAGPGNIPTFFDCWYGALAFTFQIYFDFSAYSDMAIGLGRIFGIRLPLNLCALQGVQHYRFLASLAHNAFPVPAGLPVFLSWREPAGAVLALCQYSDRDASGRPVAWRRLGFYPVGRAPWPLHHRQPRVAGFSFFMVWPSGIQIYGVGADLHRGGCRLGAVSRERSRDGVGRLFRDGGSQWPEPGICPLSERRRLANASAEYWI